MGSTGRHSHTHIDITHVRSRSPSQGSQDDELHETGVQVSPAEISPQYSVIHPSQSQSGSSSHHGDFVQLGYPNDYPQGDGSDSASRVGDRDRVQTYASRSNSRRQSAGRQQSVPDSRTRDPRETAPTVSGDSTEEFLARAEPRHHMPRPQSYYDHPGYAAHSSSSGSYPYPPVPPSNQMIPLQAQPMAVPYPPQYPHMQSPAPSGYPGAFGHPAPSQVGSPYTLSPYAAPSIVSYGGPPGGGYFPQYPPQFNPQQYQPQYLQYAQQMPYPYMIPPPVVPSPQPGSAHISADKLDLKKDTDPEEMYKRFADLMKEKELSKEAQAAEKAKADAASAEQEVRYRDQALKQAADKARQDAIRAEEERQIREDAIRAAEAKARADAAAIAERMAAEQRIREEAKQEALRAYEEKVKQAADQAAREQLIRKEAAEAALKAAAAEAAAMAEKAATEKKIADEAAAAAKSQAEKEAAEAAAAAKEAAETAQKEAEGKLKEAEEAAAKAKAEAEEAEKKAAAAAPAEKKAPVRFKDAIGRSFKFPWERCCRWRDMESLINQAFAHIDNLAEHVMHGRYDLIGPDKEIIMPNYWESTIEPDMHITMMLWPIPEPKKEDEPPVPPEVLDTDGILNLDDILNPPRRKGAKKKKPAGGGLANWMLGGPPGRTSSRSGRSLKGDKKPDVAARSQHGAAEQGSCTVM
ncbi:hypothetical protein LTR10_022269 [Elasticomyces elasticus]|uniref:Ubiquitin-like domain-containing protein n=1 Tax=Exophiala sideris TaxID=1016849 RepID=A0ABR0J1Z2_9EURO|nr:hypothetical protein LTR10_022269 [Elasticomyces elasticus]KAK5024033.1 hypothetical protein LTS07_008767 [Exophiala sideris]KAK5029105.1 hypothetical protein LTR13_008976 [Exophiala sideris]KAK5054745.1 hypothetical protein LTR69_008652 [Exophiala sideris]KAK5178928.1 hypothetical protein LTR44_008757 [Eurotiomycetes sp. CCFEE 6388]